MSEKYKDHIYPAVVFSICITACFVIAGVSIKKEKNIKPETIIQKNKSAQKENIYEVYASRIGLIGNTTFSGLVIKPNSTFVALPSKKVQKKYIKVTYKKSYAICQVLDLGPWSRNNPYWEKGEKPKAERKVADSNIYSGIAKNKAGIDLSDGLWDKLGIKRGLGIVKVKWQFVDISNNDKYIPVIND